MKNSKYYHILIETLLSEQSDDDLPPLPSRAEIAKRKLDHVIKTRKLPSWLAYINALTFTHYTRLELRIPLDNTDIIEQFYIKFDYITQDGVSELDAPARISAYTAHDAVTATESLRECNKILSKVFNTPITDCRALDHDSTGSEVSSQTVDKIFEDFLSTHTNIDSILERIKDLKK